MARQYATGGPLGGGYVADNEDRSFALNQTYISAPSAAAAKTLAAVSGSYALTGTVATPKLGRLVTATAGSYSLTGADTTLTKRVSYKLAADAGTYALSGAATTLLRTYRPTAVSGSYSLTGAVAALKHGWKTAAVAGSYSLTGTSANLKRGFKAAAVSGSYALSGATAALRHTYKATAVAGAYTLTGTPVNLLKPGAYAIIGLPGSYALTGTATTLVKTSNKVVAAIAGSYSLTGTAATLLHGDRLSAVAGSYVLTGAAANLKHGWKTLAVSGSYSLSGQVATFRRTWRTTAVSGSYALSGQPATFRRTWKTTAVPGSYALTGIPVNLLKPGAYAIIGLPGSYALTGNAASLVKAGAPITPPVYSDIATVLYAPRTNTVVAKPAATVDGDILLVSLIIGKSGVSPGPVTPPAGWTRIGTRTAVNDGSFFANFYAFWKRASGEPANYTFVHAAASTQAQIVAYSNCVPAGNPIDAYSVTFGNTNNNHVGDGEGNYWYDYASITTSIVKTKLVLLSHNWDGSGGLTAPSLTPFGTVLMTERFDSLVYSSDEDDTSVGATGIRTMRHLTAAPFGGYLIALKPADAPVAWFIQADPGGYGIAGADAVIGGGLIVLPGSYALTGAPVSLYYPSVPVVPPGSGQRDGDGGRAGAVRKRRRPQIFFIITQEAKKVVERPGPVRKKRKKIAKIIAEEVLPEAGGLLAADQLLLELMIRRQLEQIPLGDLHTEAWPRLQEMLMQVITDAEQTAQRLRAEAEEEDDLLLLLTS